MYRPLRRIERAEIYSCIRQVHRTRSAKIMYRVEKCGSRSGTRRVDALHIAVSAGCSSHSFARRSTAFYGASAKGTFRRFFSALSRISLRVEHLLQLLLRLLQLFHRKR